MFDEYERMYALHIKILFICLRNLMELVPGKAISCFKVAGVTECILVFCLFAQGNVDLHRPPKDTFAKMLLLDSHGPDVYHQTLLALDRLNLRACIGKHLLLEAHNWRNKIRFLHIDVVKASRSVW